jgi:hypothetical protein
VSAQKAAPRLASARPSSQARARGLVAAFSGAESLASLSPLSPRSLQRGSSGSGSAGAREAPPEPLFFLGRFKTAALTDRSPRTQRQALEVKRSAEAELERSYTIRVPRPLTQPSVDVSLSEMDTSLNTGLDERLLAELNIAASR